MKEHLAGEGVIPRVQRRKLAHQLEDVSVAGEPGEQGLARGDGVLGGGPLPGVKKTDAGQNPPIAAGLTGGPPPPMRRSDAARPSRCVVAFLSYMTHVNRRSVPS